LCQFALLNTVFFNPTTATNIKLVGQPEDYGARANLQLALSNTGFLIRPLQRILKFTSFNVVGINNKISDGYAYYLTLTIEEWIDVFTRPRYKHIIVDSLNYCIANKGLEIYCWCLMSNHLHLVACASEGSKLSDILRDFKKYTSKAIVETIKDAPESRRDWMLNLFWYAGKNNKKIKYFKVWQDGNDAQEIHTTFFLEEKMNYIHNNPVKAELVGRPEDYLYSSARDYSGEKGLVNILFA
jgi:REP element-mobilizing transposase RayT